ncbi:hypothetical protein ACNF49_41735 [Actinomadura sp. ATCC 39365]|uniref:hypothetical protein n=1 Tax=Nonomuraea sp. NPDC005692 TaxID=3157168 RepID=UPI0033D9C091
MHIKLPATITQAKSGQQARSPHRHDQPARDLKPTGRANLSRRPTAAPRRGGY